MWGTQGADLYLQSVPVYEDIDWAGKTHRGILREKWPPALSTKWLKPSVFGYKNRSIYTHTYTKPVHKIAKAKGIGHLSQTGFLFEVERQRSRGKIPSRKKKKNVSTEMDPFFF